MRITAARAEAVITDPVRHYRPCQVARPPAEPQLLVLPWCSTSEQALTQAELITLTRFDLMTDLGGPDLLILELHLNIKALPQIVGNHRVHVGQIEAGESGDDLCRTVTPPERCKHRFQ